MIDLHQFPQVWGVNASPFCLKVETYLKLTGIPHKRVPALPYRAPKGKLPYITDHGESGDDTKPPVVVADSGAIIDHLKATRGDRLDSSLEPDQRAQGHLIRRTLEESLFFVLLYGRWGDPAGWERTRAAFFGGMPPLVRALVPRLIRRNILGALHAQGYGRHSPDEVAAIGRADLDAVAVFLRDRRFLLGDAPTSVDAVGYGFLVNLLRVPIESPLQHHARGLGVFDRYLDRLDSIMLSSEPTA
jgi:glutathione S-transferase